MLPVNLGHRILSETSIDSSELFTHPAIGLTRTKL